MPTYQIQAPDGKTYEIDGPPGASQTDVINAVLSLNPTAGQAPPPPKEGIMAALTGGAKRFGSTLETGLESIIDPTLAAQRGVARGEEISQQYAPGASLEKVKQAYEQKGLFPAAYEAISQIPSALAEQAPNIAASLSGARAGAMAGSPFGPVGAVVGGVGGAFVPSLMQLYGSNLQRQAEEKAPEISRAKALGTAIPGAAAEVASTFIPLGRNLVGKLLGPQAEKALARGTNESIEAAAKEGIASSLTKGAGVGVLAEIPTEVGQQMLERLQAGLPLTTPDALAEYGEAAYGAGLVGAPFGAAARGLGRPAARAEYENLLQTEQAKEDAELDRRAAETAKEQKQQIQRTQSQLGVPVAGENVSNVLMLPAPGKTYEEPKDLLQDPVGRITEDELGKAIGDNTVVNYLNKYRRDNNLPKLKSYSVEDIKDAMTAQNPEGEEGALNSILAYKTGYKNETYTVEDINNVAVAKNVATETKGFSDFLTRATGKSDLNTMTQPQLHSVAKALEALPRTGKEEQLVLPEGSNATRFTQDQYNQGVTTALMGVKQGKPVSLDQARNAVKAQTDLKTDRDADQVLRTAASNEDLIIERGTGFQATNKTGEVLGTYGTEAEARRNHRRADITPVETQLVRAPEEIKTDKTAKLPEGYGIEKTAEVGEERPAAFVLREEGSQKNASQTFAEEIDAKRHQELLVRKREATAAAKDAEADRIRKQLEAQQGSIAQMEADGLTGTAEHTKAVNAFKAANVSKSDQITKLLEEAQVLRTPLQVVPLGKKSTKVEKHTVIKGGKKLGTFPNRTEAEKSILTQSTDEELQTIADRGGAFGKRAEVELGERKRTAPGIKVKGTAEGLEKAGVRTPETEAKIKELEAKLKPMLDKFGLGDVALNVVRAINNNAEGSFKGTDKLIQIAFDATNPIKTMRHEALHALKELGFFTPQQWKALEKQAKDKWIGQYLENVKFDATTSRLQAYRNLGLTEDDIIEEAIADAFGDFEAAGKAPAGMLDALFKRLQQFFKALRQALTGAGFESAEEIFGKIEGGKLKAGKQAEAEGDEKFALKTVQDVIDDGVRRLVESARKYNVKDLQERMGVGLARADTSFTKIEDGIEKRLAALGVSTNPQDDNNAFGVVFNKVRPAVNEQLRKDAEERNKRSFNAPSQDNAWQADEQTIEAADEYEEENGIRPYVSEGFLDLPTDGEKYSLQKYNPEKHLSFDAVLGVPINKNGLITLYYHTTKENAVKIGNKKVIPSEGRNRVYLTNESNGADVLRNRGNFDQEFDGSTVLVYVHPDMLQLDDVQDNGRRDFYIPLAQGDFFNKKMKLQSIQKSRKSAIVESFSYSEHETKIAEAIQKYKDATSAERKKMVASARKLLKLEHNVGTLLTENGKLEKTRVGEYDLDWDGNSVASMGLGLASAQQISEKVSTCPRSGICEGLCLGETSGGNFMFGGAASEDVGDIKKSSFRAAARMMQYLKTEALVVHPEEFAMVLQAEIDSLAKWCASETENKRDPETKERQKIAKEIYQPAVRLNVTSDFKPTMFRAIIEANPDTMFYDYTKLGSESIAPNHHLTYSSTGFGQIVKGEKVFFKDKSGKYDHNWATMRSRLNNGQNVAMAFSSKSGIPSFLVDEETGVQYRVWNGDDYDARFLDPKQADGMGMIIGLKNKAGNLSEKNATEKTGGFFVQYDPKTDGDTVVVPKQAQFKGLKDVAVTTVKPEERFSLKTYFPTAEEAESAAYKKAPPGTAEFKRFFGGSRVMEEGRAQPMFHASMEDISIFRENRPIFVSPDAGFAEDFIKRRIRESGSLSYLSEGKNKTAKIYPLWVRAETPFDYENNDHVKQIMEHLYPKLPIADTSIEKEVKAGNWSRIEDPKFQAALKLFGYDSFYTNEGGAKNLAVFKANQVKSITGNLGSFDESGDIRYSLRSAPTTPEFKRWFSSSKVVNEDGSPKVMYHGTNKDFNKFVIAEKANRTGMPDGFYFTSDQEDASRYAKGEGANVLPVYLSIKNPFNLGGKNKISKEMVMQFRDELRADNPNLPFSWIQEKVNIFKENTTAGRFPFPSINFPTAAMQRVFEVGGYDGLIDGSRVFVAFNSSQVKSATGNTGAFDRANPDIRYSLKPVSADIDAAIDRTTTAREDKGFIGRILEAIFPQSAGHFRAQALNRYNQLGVYDRMLADKAGGAVMLADQSAESAALMSDLSASVTASAFGYGNRTGGVPTYRNGITTIDTSVKGPIAILASLAKYNNPRIYQRYQFWAGVKRGKRFMADGKEKNFEQADIARAAQLEKEHPEFVQIQKEMNEFNNGLVKYMVQTGVIDPAKAKIYMEHADYIPFYRQMDGERTIGPNIFQSISGVKPPKALKGSEAPLADYLETIVRNTQSAIQSGMKNTAAQRAVNVAMQLGPKVGAERLKTQESGFDIVQVLEKGERVSYRVADTLFIDACRSLNLPDLPFMGFLTAPANALRNLVTKDPGFMLANLMRDSLSSWVTSGTSVKPIIGTISGFTKALSGKSASMEALLNAGILGGYEFSSGVLKSGEVLESDLNKKYGKTTGAKVLLKPFTSLWDALEKGTEASDAATRIAIYERVLADTGNEAEAIFRSLEVMNFNRKGSSAIIRIATAAIPFLNARMQGLDIFYRASFGRDTVADPAAKQKAFFVRGATLMALSIAMYIMVSDDDEYKKQEDETKDNYWIIPGVGKFPTPFEVGFLFKTVPERIYAAMFKDDTGEDFKEAMKRGIISTLAFNPIPQTVKPLIEGAWNYNSFTGRVIVGAGMENRSPEFQVGPGTSEVAQRIGSLTGLSPLKVDHVWQGYTGTIGMYLVQAVDSVLNANDNSPNASKRFEQLPIIKRFALDPEARGNITQFYALKNATDQAVTTINFLERSGDAEAYAKYFEENAGLLANKNYVNSIEKQMKKYREMRSMVQSAEMTGDEKRDLLIDIGRAENALNENIKEVKKMIKEVQ